MTIAEKSTELGIDLAQLVLNKQPLGVCKENGLFHCFTFKYGEKTNIRIINENEDLIAKWDNTFRWSDDTLAENSTKEQVETAFKSYVNGLEFLPLYAIVTTYEDLT